MENTETTYTLEEYTRLTEEQKRALRQIINQLGYDPDETLKDEGELNCCLNLLKPCDGCVPFEEVDTGVLEAIRNKLSAFYYPAMVEAEETLNKEHDDPHAVDFRLVIDPSYEHHSCVAIVDGGLGASASEPNPRPFCYHYDSFKVWSLEFPTLTDLADEYLSIRDALLGEARRLVPKKKNSP